MFNLPIGGKTYVNPVNSKKNQKMTIENELDLCKELKLLKEEMICESNNGMKIIKDYWNEVKPRYEYYKKNRISVKESLFYALLDVGIDPYNPKRREEWKNKKLILNMF